MLRKALGTAVVLLMGLVGATTSGATAAAATAPESGAFIVRLGRDTVGVQSFRRDGGTVDVRQAGRTPRVLQRHIVYDMTDDGTMRHFSFTVTDPTAVAGAPPVQQVDATFSADSMLATIGLGANARALHVAMPPKTVLLVGASPWEMYECLSERLAAQKADTLRRPAIYVGTETIYWVALRRLGRDSIEIENAFDVYHAKVDRVGHLLHIRPLHGTQQFTVDRVMSVDLAAYTAAFAADEKRAGAMGALSTRDTVKVSAGGAALWIDYGRPAKRGRDVFGALVPWNAVWRTGANAATQFKTDRALSMNGTTVPAGFYTLWSIPTPTGTKLVINSQTGQWGTEHDPAKDLYTIDMNVSALAQPAERFTISVEPNDSGGLLRLDWDTRRSELAFKTLPN
jgi:hypothetical protein